jgi:glycosyltransferase involved in cell wall biosynthesis
MKESNETANNRVLIVTGSYAPTMLADMHRARQLAWELPARGWDVEILCPDISYQPVSCNDPDSDEFFASAVKTYPVPSWLPRLFRFLGIGSIGLRALVPLYIAGCKLLASGRFTIIYLSTAQAPLLLLGPAWRSRFKIPYVIDLHDPIAVATTNAGGRLKQRLNEHFTRYIERHAMRNAAGIIAVSPQYIEIMKRRYADCRPDWLRFGHAETIPFGVLPQDLQEARRGCTPQAGGFGKKRIVYVGTGGPIMARAFLQLCRVLAELRRSRPHLIQNVTIELHGTASPVTPEANTHLAHLAADLGVQDLIAEYPKRVSYRTSLGLLLECDGAIVLGVDDASYMPSKLVIYAHSGKPLLACVHRDGPAFAMLRDQPALGHALWFIDRQDMPFTDAVAVVGRFLEEVIKDLSFTRTAQLEPYTASAMAGRHAELFEACLAQAFIE